VTDSQGPHDVSDQSPVTTLRDMNVTDAASTTSAESLRTALVAQLREQGSLRTDRVTDAFLAVPRHLFLPGVPLTRAYENDSVVTKRNEHGVSISSVSQPGIVAMMLEQAEVEPGHRVLEIGSGGYNAALLTELVGPTGAVTSIDIDADVIDRAHAGLAASGYTSVNAFRADGEFGAKGDAPFDRIIVTVGAWDVPPAWVEQLAEGGRIVVPVRMRGLTRSVVFERDGGQLVSRSVEVCGFVAMQGAGEHDERLVLLFGKEVGLRFDDEPPHDVELLNGVLASPRTEVWSGVTVGNTEPFDTLQVWLATTVPGFCWLAVDPELDTGIVKPANRMASPAVVDGATFAYLTTRKAPSEPGTSVYEFGVHGHGPDADKVAARFNEQVQVWDRSYRGGKGPRIRATPVGAPDEPQPGGSVIRKKHVTLTVSWT
jgi:protein-L-isoaspartate(D-aspartate) O-methyltransferase